MDKIRNMEFKHKPAAVKQKRLEPFSSQEINSILTSIQKSGEVSAIMSIREPFSERFHNSQSQLPCTQAVPSDITSIFFSSFFRSSYLNLDRQALMLRINEIKLFYSDQQVQLVENLTKNQSKSKEWFRLRAGRVTASVFKSVCRTSLLSPSISLLKRICYSDVKGSSEAMRYGIHNEATARIFYGRHMAEKHRLFKVVQCGLYINNKFPHLGASPDGITSCKCCGNGVVEIKCPYSSRNDANLNSYI